MAEKRTTTIRTDYLARVEGEGAMLVEIGDGVVEEVQLKIYEPPRFFEAFLRGRALHGGARHHRAHLRDLPGRLPDELVQAMEQACGVEVDGQLRALRRLLYCGEWIESHALHVFMLHAPDFLGYESAIELARDHPELVGTGARAEEDRQRAHDGRRRPRGAPDQRAGRRLVPGAAQARARRARREARTGARDRARDGALDRAARLPRLRAATTSSSRSPSRASTRSTAAGSSRAAGLDIARRGVRGAFRRGARGVVERAALARCAGAARTSAARWPASRSLPTGSRRSRARPRRRPASAPAERNPFRSIVVRCGRARLRGRRGAAADRRVRGAGRARRRSRAAGRRRLRLHRGAARASSTIATRSTTKARSSTPRSCRRLRRTSARSRRTCAASLSARSILQTTSLRLLCEQTIRNYDPCISCATHFLELEVGRC